MIIDASFEQYNVKWNLDEKMGGMTLFYLQTVLKAAISATYSTSLETQIWLKQFLHTFFADQWIKLQ